MRKSLLSLATAAFIALSGANAFADHHEKGEMKEGMSEMAPKSVIHVVTVSWKEDAKEADIKAALDGVKQIAKDYEGVTRVWVKTIKAQGERSHAFVMEFKDEQALKDYAGSDAQEKWYESYLAVRGSSTTFDITN